MFGTIFISIFTSCEDTGVQNTKKTEASAEKKEKQYPGEMNYFPEDNLKCRAIAPGHVECWDIEPNKD